MRNSTALYIPRIFLIAFVLVIGVSTASAQQRSGFFVEPQTHAAWLLDEAAYLVGLRAGLRRSGGVSYDFGFDVLAGATSSRSPGPGAGDAIRRLMRASTALRYAGVLSERFGFDIGASVSVGLAEAESCGGTDVCFGGGLYLGAGPEAGATLVIAESVGVRFSAGYVGSLFVLGPRMSGPSLGIGIRFWP